MDSDFFICLKRVSERTVKNRAGEHESEISLAAEPLAGGLLHSDCNLGKTPE